MEDNEVDGLSDLLISGVPDYERISYIANNSLLFRSKSLNEWTAELSFSGLTDDLSLEELERYNGNFIRQSEIVMTNLSYARSSMDLAKLQYTRRMFALKESILDNRSSAGARAPSKEVLEIMAMKVAADDYSAFQISEILLEFWITMHAKLKLINDRLTSMNILRNVESRYAIQQ